MNFKVIAEKILTRVQAKLAGLNEEQLQLMESMADQLATVNQTITPVKSEVTPTEVSARDVLAAMGSAFDIRHENGLETKAVVLKAADLPEGINVEQMFPGKTVVKSGFIVNLSLREQIQLIEAITKAKPELAGQIGLYNLKGSESVHKALKAADLHNQSDIWWFWTGERYNGSDIEQYSEAIIVPEELEGVFCGRDFNDGDWDDYDPDDYGFGGAVVLGAQ